MKAVLLPPCSTSVCVSKDPDPAIVSLLLWHLCSLPCFLCADATLHCTTTTKQPRSTALHTSHSFASLSHRSRTPHQTRRTASFTLKQTRYPAEATGPAAIFDFPYNGLVIQGSLPSIRHYHGDAWDCPGCANGWSSRLECLHLWVWRPLTGHASCRAQKALVDRRPDRSKSYESFCCVKAARRRAWVS